MSQTQDSAPSPGAGWIGWVFLAVTVLLIAAGVRVFRRILAAIGPDAAAAIARGARSARHHRSG